MADCLLVGLGGFIGSIFRYLIGLLPISTANGFPIKTLAINILGSFLIGIIAVFASKHESLNPHIILMIKMGICGGFTTFSTFAYEVTDLLKNGITLTDMLYICMSIILCVVLYLLHRFYLRKIPVELKN